MHRKYPINIRAFLSSPGDVKKERATALKILKKISLDYNKKGTLNLEIITWDDQDNPVPMEAGISPQESIDKYKGMTSKCDFTIVIIGSRIGSSFTNTDGKTFESGTIYEFEAAIHAKKPVYVYRCQRDLKISSNDTKIARAEKITQFDAVDSFFNSKFKNSNGFLSGGYTTTNNEKYFIQKLTQDINTILQEYLHQHEKPFNVQLFDESNSAFLGRVEQINRLDSLIISGKNACILQKPGIGKTYLVKNYLKNNAKLLINFGGILWIDLGKHPDLLPQLQTWAAELAIPDEIITNLSDIDALKKEIQVKIGHRRILVVIDDIWKWHHAKEIMNLAPKGVFIFTTRDSNIATDLGIHHQEQIIWLPGLDEINSLSLLSFYSPRAVEISQNRAKLLIKNIAGSPIAIKLIGKYLNKKTIAPGTGKIATTKAFNNIYKNLIKLSEDGVPCSDENQNQSVIHNIVHTSWEELSSDIEKEFIVNLSIFMPEPHTFSRTMIINVCKIDNPDDYLENFKSLGLIEPQKNRVDPEDDYYSIHPIIHRFLREHLTEKNKSSLNKDLLSWYSKKVTTILENKGDDIYNQWYRYEDIEWQEAKNCWLYYLAINEDIVASMLEFLRVYFDAFWWWGFFDSFEFCNQLINEWRQRDISPEQIEGLELLEKFSDNFPIGMGRRGEKNKWIIANSSLNSIITRLSLNELSNKNESAARIIGMINFLQAEYEAYGNNNHYSAIKLATQSHSYYAQHDKWTAGYLSFYIAQYNLDIENLDCIEELVQRGFDEANHQAIDPELYANIWRINAEYNLKINNFDVAKSSWINACFYAIIYQSYPQPADNYTIKYYTDMINRVCESLRDLSINNLSSSSELACSIYEFLDPWWRINNPKYTFDIKNLRAALRNHDTHALGEIIFPTPKLRKINGNQYDSDDVVNFSNDIKKISVALSKKIDINLPHNINYRGI